MTGSYKAFETCCVFLEVGVPRVPQQESQKHKLISQLVKTVCSIAVLESDLHLAERESLV